MHERKSVYNNNNNNNNNNVTRRLHLYFLHELSTKTVNDKHPTRYELQTLLT